MLLVFLVLLLLFLILEYLSDRGGRDRFCRRSCSLGLSWGWSGLLRLIRAVVRGVGLSHCPGRCSCRATLASSGAALLSLDLPASPLAWSLSLSRA